MLVALVVAVVLARRRWRGRWWYSSWCRPLLAVARPCRRAPGQAKPGAGGGGARTPSLAADSDRDDWN
jgi:hypothetical protein